jgi:hypothetical protein
VISTEKEKKMNGITPLGQLVQEYLRKYPSYSSRRLAEMIYSIDTGIWKDSEQVRSMIRYYRGTCGEVLRKNLAAESYIPKVTIAKSDNTNWEPLVLTENDFPLIAGGDMQIPFHDQDIIEMFVERAIKTKAKTILLMGDIADCYSISDFVPDPRLRNYVSEVALTKEILGSIRSALPKARIIWKKGNHEFRLDRYFRRKAPELYGLETMSFENVYGLKDLNIELVEDKRIIKYNKLHFIHGHEYANGLIGPVNPARTLLLKAKKPTAEWHFHRSNAQTDKAINDDITTCWSVGCMCDLHPEYRPLNDWQHGFAEVEIDSDGYWTFHNRKIINYRYV